MGIQDRIEGQDFFKGLFHGVTSIVGLTPEDLIRLRERREYLVEGLAGLITQILEKELSEQEEEK